MSYHRDNGDYYKEIHIIDVDYCRFCGKKIRAKIQYQTGYYTYGAYRVVGELDGNEHIPKWGYLCGECKNRSDRKELIKEVDRRGTYQQSNFRHRYPLVNYPAMQEKVDDYIYADKNIGVYKSKDDGETWEICNPFDIPKHAKIKKDINKIKNEIKNYEEKILELKEELKEEWY